MYLYYVYPHIQIFRTINYLRVQMEITIKNNLSTKNWSIFGTKWKNTTSPCLAWQCPNLLRKPIHGVEFQTVFSAILKKSNYHLHVRYIFITNFITLQRLLLHNICIFIISLFYEEASTKSFASKTEIIQIDYNWLIVQTYRNWK